MEIIAWILVVVFAGLAGYLGFRLRDNPYPEALKRLTAELRGGEVERSAFDDPPEVEELRVALKRSARVSHGTHPASGRPTGQERPTGPERADDRVEEAMRGLFRYLDEAVLAPLEGAAVGDHAGEALEDAINALQDLAFYSRGAREESHRSENLSWVVRAVTREYSEETGVPVRFDAPSGTLAVRMQPEGFKDALYLLLANAGRFGAGEEIEVVTEAEGDDVTLRVRDRGPGFSVEALERGFDPFWTSEPDALGLGLTYARKFLEIQGARLEVDNLEGGGAEAAIVLPRAR